jgi:hypothetical protein
METHFEVAAYAPMIVRETAHPNGIAERMLIADLPRRFHQLTPELRRKALLRPAPTTGSRQWDAYLAAVVEHIALLHDLEPPTWTQKPELFLDIPWITSTNPIIRLRSILYPPPAFVRHGVFPDPKELDFRGGEKWEWVFR